MTRLTLRQDAIDRLAEFGERFVRAVRDQARISVGDGSETTTGVVRIAPGVLRPAPPDEEPVFRFPRSHRRRDPPNQTRPIMAAPALAGGPAVMSTETTEISTSAGAVDVAALPRVTKPGKRADQVVGARPRGQRPRAGDQPVEPAVRDPPRRADARRACRLRHADRWRPVRRRCRRAVRDRRRHRLWRRPRRDRPDGRNAVGGRARRHARGDRRGRAGRDIEPAEGGRSRGRAGRDRA